MVSLVPNVDSTAKITESELPTYEDFKIDPASALAALTGNYRGEIDEAKAFQELLNAAIQQGYQQAKQEKLKQKVQNSQNARMFPQPEYPADEQDYPSKSRTDMHTTPPYTGAPFRDTPG